MSGFINLVFPQMLQSSKCAYVVIVGWLVFFIFCLFSIVEKVGFTLQNFTMESVLTNPKNCAELRIHFFLKLHVWQLNISKETMYNG